MTHVTQSNVTVRPFARGFPIRPLRIIPSASSPCWVFLIQPRSDGRCTNILSALILEPAGGNDAAQAVPSKRQCPGKGSSAYLRVVKKCSNGLRCHCS